MVTTFHQNGLILMTDWPITEPMDQPDDIPEVDLSDFERIKHERFRELENQREHIIAYYNAQIAALQQKFREELRKNWDAMQSLGLKLEELPPAPPSPEDAKRLEMGLTRKLDSTEIKRILASVMEQGEEYPSSFLLGHLKISYADLKRFVKEHPDFIKFEGINRWRTYKRCD